MNHQRVAILAACTRTDIREYQVPQTKELVIADPPTTPAPAARPKPMWEEIHLTIHDILYHAHVAQHQWQSKAEHIDSKKPFHKRIGVRRSGDRRNWI